MKTYTIKYRLRAGGIHYTLDRKVKAHSEGYAMRNALTMLMNVALWPVEISAEEAAS